MLETRNNHRHHHHRRAHLDTEKKRIVCLQAVHTLHTVHARTEMQHIILFHFIVAVMNRLFFFRSEENEHELV